MYSIIFWVLVVWYWLDLICSTLTPEGKMFEHKRSDKVVFLIKFILLFILFHHIYVSGVLG